MQHRSDDIAAKTGRFLHRRTAHVRNDSDTKRGTHQERRPENLILTGHNEGKNVRIE